MLGARCFCRSTGLAAAKFATDIPNVGKALQLRAVLFDAELLLMEHEHDPAQLMRLSGSGVGTATAGDAAGGDTVAVPSLQQLREQASRAGSGLDAVAALDKLRGAGGAAYQDCSSAPSDAVCGDPSSAGGVRGKYLAKMRQVAQRVAEREADPRRAADSVFGQAGTPQEEVVSSGTVSLLRYLKGRGVLLGLAMPDPAACSAAQLAAFEEQLGDRFSFRLPHAGGTAEYPSGTPLAALSAAQGFAPSNMMLLTVAGPAIVAARDAGCFSTFFHVKNARKPNARPDFTIQALLDLQNVTEELNGISWRGVST